MSFDGKISFGTVKKLLPLVSYWFWILLDGLTGNKRRVRPGPAEGLVLRECLAASLCTIFPR